MKSSFLIFLFYSSTIFAQEDFFLVELEPFSPDVNTMIQMMEGNPAESFEASDVEGKAQNFDEFLDKDVMVFWFWSIEDEMSVGLIDGINLISQIFEDRIKFLTFTYENPAQIQSFMANKSINFDIVPSSLRISDLLYGSELGVGRIVLIDKNGIVKKALPRQFFIDNDNSFNQLRTLIDHMINDSE